MIPHPVPGEDIPMTMQVAIQARDGFVLASDTKNRILGDPVSSFMYHSKIAHSEKHQVLISMMGFVADADADPAHKLAKHLQDSASCNREHVEVWAQDYLSQRTAENAEDNFSLLLVHPASQHDQMWKIAIKGGVVTSSRSLQWVVFHGNEHNPAILWPEFLKAEGRSSLSQAINIAALTIMTGGDISPSHVKGLEVWSYKSKWERLSSADLDQLYGRYENLKRQLHRFISVAGLTSRVSS